MGQNFTASYDTGTYNRGRVPVTRPPNGELAERLNARASKARGPARGPEVRILHSPPAVFAAGEVRGR